MPQWHCTHSHTQSHTHHRGYARWPGITQHSGYARWPGIKAHQGVEGSAPHVMCQWTMPVTPDTHATHTHMRTRAPHHAPTCGKVNSLLLSTPARWKLSTLKWLGTQTWGGMRGGGSGLGLRVYWLGTTQTWGG